MLESGKAVFQGFYLTSLAYGPLTCTRADHDFFTPQPVQNAAVFLLRVITHDWPDEFVTRILLQLRHAATPQTKLILVDYVLPLACEDHTEDIGAVRTLAPPSSGLLPNLGKANANAFWLDMTASRFAPSCQTMILRTGQMHVTFNSKERTLREMTDIALSAGWQVTEVIRRPEGSLFGSIVAVPISVPPSGTLLSPFIEQEIIERSVSPRRHFLLPLSIAVAKRSRNDDEPERFRVRRMTKRLRKTISKTFSRAGQSGEPGGGEKGRPIMAKSASA
jgi:hypothetical protein